MGGFESQEYCSQVPDEIAADVVGNGNIQDMPRFFVVAGWTRWIKAALKSLGRRGNDLQQVPLGSRYMQGTLGADAFGEGW
jgi:hypothetical protein